MKTKEQVLEQVKAGKESQCLDRRDFSRLIDYYPIEDWGHFGFSLKESAGRPPAPKKWTKENIIADMQGDVSFGFEKALDQRGISSGLMHEVVLMWLWVLDDPLADFEEYAPYGLPLFKAVALKHGFKNEIGDDSGTERKYEG